MQIERTVNSNLPYDLLYLADEDDEQIGRYRDSALFWGAVEETRIIGIIGLKLSDKESAEIVSVAVEAAHQNKGIGTRLIEEVITYCREEGFKEILIKTGNCGMSQIALYQRCGFRFHSINKDYFTRFYRAPIYEGDIRCMDQIVLRYRLYCRDEIDATVDAYWNRFLEAKREYEGKSYTVWNFCYGEYLPNKLLGLVRTGKKTATASARDLYGEDEKVPEAGDLSIITYGNGLPGCIIETKEVRVKPFKEISKEEAALEGEGDLSLEYWRNAHRWFFELEYREAGKHFSEDIPVLFERFEVIFDEDQGEENRENSII